MKIENKSKTDIGKKMTAIQKKYKNYNKYTGDFIFVEPKFGNVPTRIPEKSRENIKVASYFF